MKILSKTPFPAFVLLIAIFIPAMNPLSPARGEESPAKLSGLKNTTHNDDFIADYATAIITRELRLKNVKVTIRNGKVLLTTDPENEGFVKYARELISKLRGVGDKKVIVHVRAVPAKDRGKTNTLIDKDNGAKAGLPLGPEREAELFEPLIADLRWPRFSASIHNYFDKKPRSREDEFLSNVIAVSLGETIPTLRVTAPHGANFEWGIHGAAFGVFNLKGDSFDLINTDSWIAPIAISFRKNDFSGLFRFYHQSSHLGDEFILRDPETVKFALQDAAKDRINLSYWALSILLSKDFGLPPNIGERFRVYGGGEYMINGPGFFDKEPDELKEITIQYGVEYRSLPLAWLKLSSLKAVGGADFKTQEEANWKTGVSLRAGLEYENPASYPDAVFRFMAEYFNGRSPTGQFYKRAVEYYGIGISTDFQPRE